jgi:hypothetical protein
MPDAIESARQLIQSRLADLDAEAKHLRGALESLAEGSGTQRRGPARPAGGASADAAPLQRKRTRRKRKGKRAPRGQRREQLLAAIKARPGARPSELAGAIGIKPAQVHNLIGRARADKLIVKRGKGYALKG